MFARRERHQLLVHRVEPRGVLVEVHLTKLHAPAQWAGTYHLVSQRLQDLVTRVLPALLTALLELELNRLPYLTILEAQAVRVMRLGKVQDAVDDVAPVAAPEAHHVEHVDVLTVVDTDARAYRVVRLFACAYGKVPRLIDVELVASRGGTVVPEHVLREVVPVVRDGVLLEQRVPPPLLTQRHVVRLLLQQLLHVVPRLMERGAHRASHACPFRHRCPRWYLLDAVVRQQVLIPLVVQGRVLHDLKHVPVARLHHLLDATSPVILVPPREHTQHTATGREAGVRRGHVPLPHTLAYGGAVRCFAVLDRVVDD